ncbi:MAG TPA: type II secretion system F family protein [Candidatus Limnocylindria bacterium]
MIGVSPLLVAILGSATVLVVALGVLAPGYSRRRELAARLEAALGPGVGVDLAGRRRTRGVIRLGRGATNPLLKRIEAQIEHASVELSATELLAAIVILALAGAAVAFLFMQSALGALLGAVVGASLPWLWIKRRGASRQDAFKEQLADNVSLLAASVRAGHSLLQALEQVSREAPEPSRSAFTQVVREIGIGAAQEEALQRLAWRFPSEDLELVVTATNVQHQVGGSLSKVLDDIAVTLRERTRIEGDINALTAQQRYSAYVLALLPVFVGAALFIISRDYIELLFEGVLRFATALAALLVVAGFIAMKRIATIDV